MKAKIQYDIVQPTLETLNKLQGRKHTWAWIEIKIRNEKVWQFMSLYDWSIWVRIYFKKNGDIHAEDISGRLWNNIEKVKTEKLDALMHEVELALFERRVKRVNVYNFLKGTNEKKSYL